MLQAITSSTLRSIGLWNPTRRHLAVYVIGLVMLGTTLASLLINRTVSFRVIADVELVEGVLVQSAVGGAAGIRWALHAGTICSGRAGIRGRRPERRDACNLEQFDEVAEPFVLEVIGSPAFSVARSAGAALAVSLRLVAQDFRVSTRVTGSTGRVENDYVGNTFFYRAAPQPKDDSNSEVVLTWPVLAQRLQLGREMSLRGGGRLGQLLAGEVTISGTTLLGDNVYTAARVPLNLGDVVSLTDPRTPISALIRSDGEGRSLRVVARFEAQEMRVTGFNAKPRVLHLSYLNKIRGDPLLIALWSLAGFVLALLAVFDRSTST